MVLREINSFNCISHGIWCFCRYWWYAACLFSRAMNANLQKLLNNSHRGMLGVVVLQMLRSHRLESRCVSNSGACYLVELPSLFPSHQFRSLISVLLLPLTCKETIRVLSPGVHPYLRYLADRWLWEKNLQDRSEEEKKVRAGGGPGDQRTAHCIQKWLIMVSPLCLWLQYGEQLFGQFPFIYAFWAGHTNTVDRAFVSST